LVGEKGQNRHLPEFFNKLEKWKIFIQILIPQIKIVSFEPEYL
jgi:hypothetical protein